MTSQLQPTTPSAAHFTATLRSRYTRLASDIALFKDPFYTGSFPNIYNPVDPRGVIRGQVEDRILLFLDTTYGAYLDSYYGMYELVVTGNMDVTGRVVVAWMETKHQFEDIASQSSFYYV
ncbi:hypothetical protein PMZ80_005781 [Knufia obscura]|uniref:Uncharacterized protein n=2 Tax=Knufia TaxID=430999 RepID=A0AAN8EMQ5_9EURO|nr:hypothetical protein PMZ80_005781 [Knufia obscura]KAK5954447.1 hypothetical protein OHC33_004169 [Knufia fluminis]